VNAAEGVIAFSPEKLEVRSISKAPSVFNLWAQEPSFSNTQGRVSFEGVVLNPGFVGEGTILTITFRAKTPGTAQWSFSSGSILANDGSGTNVLTSLGTAQFTFVGAPPPTTQSEEEKSKPYVPEDVPEEIVEEPQPLSRTPVAIIEPSISLETIRLAAVSAPLIVIIMLLLWLVWYLRHNTVRSHRSLYREIHEAEETLHQAFDVLREELIEHIHELEKARTKRALTAEEEKILTQFKRKLDEAEKVIRKEIRDIAH